MPTISRYFTRRLQRTLMGPPFVLVERQSSPVGPCSSKGTNRIIFLVKIFMKKPNRCVGGRLGVLLMSFLSKSMTVLVIEAHLPHWPT